jgi:hypothetical protein
MEDIKSSISNDSCCPDLSLKTRVIGFIIFLCLGILFGILAAGAIFGFITGNLNNFIIFYSLSTASSIAGSFFLKGPKSQWKTITHPKRMIPSIIFLVAFIMTFVSVYLIESKILAIIFLLIQLTAGIFYVLTFFPYGKELCFKCCKSCFSCEDSETGGNF